MTIAELVAASRAAQGLPPRVADPSTIRHIAGLLTTQKAAPTDLQVVGAAKREGTRDAPAAA